MPACRSRSGVACGSRSARPVPRNWRRGVHRTRPRPLPRGRRPAVGDGAVAVAVVDELLGDADWHGSAGTVLAPGGAPGADAVGESHALSVGRVIQLHPRPALAQNRLPVGSCSGCVAVRMPSCASRAAFALAVRSRHRPAARGCRSVPRPRHELATVRRAGTWSLGYVELSDGHELRE